jgi:hypothetical protein
MKSFKELGLKTNEKKFIGKKIEPDSFLNETIIVHYYKSELSKFPKPNHPYVMTIQITIDNEKRVIFTGSKSLYDVIVQATETDFPFRAKIIRVKETKEFVFTDPD